MEKEYSIIEGVLYLSGNPIFRSYSVTATTGGDYDQIFTPVTFLSSSVDGAERCIPVGVKFDGMVEHQEDFVAQLDLVTLEPNFSIGNNMSSVIIIDSDGN